jgi:hypothetical protein
VHPRSQSVNGIEKGAKTLVTISHDETAEQEQEDVGLVIFRMIGYGGAGTLCLLFTALTNPILKGKQTSY